MNFLEDEIHFFLICPVYSDFRKRCIKPDYYHRAPVFILVQLLNVNSTKILTNLGKYLRTLQINAMICYLKYKM